MQKKGWLIYSEKDAKRNHSYIDWFKREAERQNLTLKLIYRENLMIGLQHHQPIITYQNKKITLPDFVVNRTIDSVLSEFLEDFSIRVFNSAKISKLSNNKINTYQAMNKLNIPMVDTYFIQKKHLTKHPPLPFPFVVKNAYGRGGKNVFMIQSMEDWKKYRNKLPNQPLILQTCQVQLGKDIRVFVLGKNIIKAIMRINYKDFRANMNQGGSAKIYTLDRNEKNMIHEIIKAYHFDLVGIDFLIDPKGQLLFNEIEDVVGSRILSATTNINLLRKYTTYIKNIISPH